MFPGQHPYVDVLDAVAVKVECEGQQRSAWNLDGELLSTACLSAEVHQGLLEVFARGGPSLVTAACSEACIGSAGTVYLNIAIADCQLCTLHCARVNQQAEGCACPVPVQVSSGDLCMAVGGVVDRWPQCL